MSLKSTTDYVRSALRYNPPQEQEFEFLSLKNLSAFVYCYRGATK